MVTIGQNSRRKRISAAPADDGYCREMSNLQQGDIGALLQAQLIE